MPLHRSPSKPHLSVVVPCFNEEDCLETTELRLRMTLAALPGTYEIIFIDDGSTDRTGSILDDLARRHAEVKVIHLSRNFGHQLALTAGLDAASGDAAVLIDADLQDPPELIPAMVAKWQQGFDVVYGRRVGRTGEARFKLATAAVFYRLLNRMAEFEIPSDTGDFRLIDRRVLDVLKSMGEHDRYVRGLISWVGFRQGAVDYRRDARLAGETKYSLRKMVAFAVDGLVSFSIMPLRYATAIGAFTVFLAIVGAVTASVVRLFTDDWVRGWTLMFCSILLLGGMQLFFLGVLGEYVGRIYRQTKARPLYVVRESRGFDGKPVAERTDAETAARAPRHAA